MDEVETQNYRNKLISELSGGLGFPKSGYSFKRALVWKHSKTFRVVRIAHMVLISIFVLLFLSGTPYINSRIAFLGFILVIVISWFIIDNFIISKELNKLSTDVLKEAVTKRQAVVENYNKPLKVSSPVFKFAALFFVGLFVFSLIAIFIGMVK